MDIRTMEYFLMIAKIKNITKAAELLHMAQPPLSRQLKALEDELDVKLFIREKRKMILTDEGRFLKTRCEQILELIDKTKDQVKEMKYGVSGTLFIGSIETVGTVILPIWLADFKKKYPFVKYNLWSGNSDDVIERLENGLLDIALIREPFDTEKFESIHITNEAWIVLFHKEHQLALKDGNSIELKELRNEELIVPIRRSSEIKKWFKEINIEPNIMCEFAPLMNAVVLTEKNLGVAICPESAKFALENKNVVVKKIVNPNRESGVSLIWKKYMPLSSTIKEFIKFVSCTDESN